YKTNPGEQILVKVAVSAISAADAMQNLDSEVSKDDWDFGKLRDQTRAKWDRELSRIEIGGSQRDKETFYTAMYHAFLAPNLYQDSTGQYRGLDSNIHQAKGFKNYAVFSTWDTFRATHPLFALIQAQRDSDMINSLLAHYDQSVDHLLPIWSLQGNETWCMIGYHSVPIIADGYLKGVRGFDPERAYRAMKATAMNPDYDSVATYAKLGWVPYDQENESVSKTLEYAFDDYCIAQMAHTLGHKDDEQYFRKRADSYRNVFDPSTHQARGKDSRGQWRSPFDPHAYGEGAQADFTEGTATQYTFYDPQNVPAMIKLFGGKEKFIAQLDALFDYKEPLKTQAAEDIQGRIGEYWHGNEPSHHIIYLYTYAGAPWKTAGRLHEVMRTQYGNQPNSLTGNDDCGQMSAWYIFTALGFYPVCPSSDYYVIGSPSLSHAIMHLSNGKKFVVEAHNLSDQNIYVQSVTLNGKDWDSPLLPYRELKHGGTLVFTMGPNPSPSWGTRCPATD
ncbi:MAG: GH92 family glycosyl hydrolase, partial [Limisphaerales bacterium]